jgi:large subunit ribosomal protein L10e
MAVKRQITRLYKFRNKRSYTYIKSKQGKSKTGLSQTRILSFRQGTLKSNKYFTVKLITTKKVRLTETCIESLRVSINRKLGNNLGRSQYVLIINKYPHQILRHHRLASGAGADRVSQGMRLAFGHPLIRAINFKENSVVLQVIITNPNNLQYVKKYLKDSSKKSPIKMKVYADSENSR